MLLAASVRCICYVPLLVWARGETWKHLKFDLLFESGRIRCTIVANATKMQSVGVCIRPRTMTLNKLMRINHGGHDRY